MLHARQISTPANTSESDAVVTKFKINKGIISWVWVTFPRGCQGLLKCRIYLDEHPIVPVHKDSYIYGDDYTFAIPVMEEVLEEPSTITVRTWNDDDTYPHEIQVLILVVDKKWVVPAGATEGMIASLRSLFVREE